MTTPVAAIGKGLAYIRSKQLTSGGFESYSSPRLLPFRQAIAYRTTFVPALMLSALSSIESAQEIRSTLATWLLKQRSPNWSFNYWSKESTERRHLPYPDDLDDTFCALTALYQHDPAAIDAGVLGSAVRLLLATETAVGGPYRTWLVPKKAPAVWQDVDLAVNANIAHFLRLAVEPLPTLTNFMEQAIASGVFRSPYYPTPFPIVYYLARAYRGPLEDQLAAHILQLQPSTPLQLALSMTALHELRRTKQIAPLAHALLQQQKTNGSWAAEPFCIDPAQQGKPFYHGAAALTTAFALEALERWERPRPAITRARPRTQEATHRVLQQALTACQSLDPDLQQYCRAALERMVQGDTTDEIALLPQLFARSLTSPPRLSQQFLDELCLANLYGWTAYTIFDEFLDGTGEAAQLPTATRMLRQSLTHFVNALPERADFQQLVHNTFDTIDEANTWEVIHCRTLVEREKITIQRLPQYRARQRLAEKSLGHTLTPVAVLLAAGHTLSDPSVAAIRESLQHYLIARQLHDDAHDWEIDVKNGQLSYVVTAILKNLKLRPGTYVLPDLLRRMQHTFWHRTLLEVCDRIEEHLTKSKQTALRSGLISADSPYCALISELESALEHTRGEQAQAEKFLAAYRSPT